MGIVDCEIKKLNFSNGWVFLLHKEKTCRSIRFDLESIVLLLFNVSLVWSVVSCCKSRFWILKTTCSWLCITLQRLKFECINVIMTDVQICCVCAFFLSVCFVDHNNRYVCLDSTSEHTTLWSDTKKITIVKLLKPRNGMWRNHRSSLSCVSFRFWNAFLGSSSTAQTWMQWKKKKRIHRNYKLLLSSFTCILIIAMHRRLVDHNFILSAEHHFGHFLL